MRYVNPALEAMTGYPAKEILSMQFWELVHPDHREFVRQRGLARQEGEAVPWHYEVKLLHRSGESRWVEFSAGLIEYEGQPAVLGTAVDITERKGAADQQRESERRLRALIEQSSDIVVISETDGCIRYVGPSIKRILGFRPEALIGTNGFDGVHPDDHERVLAVYREMAGRSGSRVIAAYRSRRADGSWRWLESIATNLLDDPTIRGIIINSRDITERIEAQTGYRSLVDHSLQGLLVLQRQRIIFANPRIGVITGYTVDELLALQPPELRALVEPGGDDATSTRGQRRTGAAAESSQSEVRFVRRDGTVRWLEVYASRVENRGVPATQLACVDITDRKRAEDDARTHQQELAHVLRRSTMGEMAAMFAHEVNQPLSAIISYATGCINRLRGGIRTPEPLLDALDEIVAQAVRAGEIIRRLRRFVGKGEVQRQPLDVNDLVTEVMHFVTPEARERQVRVEVELAEGLPPLQGDAVQIEQVILNLLRNALESMYADPGERPLLAVSTRQLEHEVEVAVCDSGGGLQPDLAADVFEPFVTSKSAGLGMGLSICRSIIGAHGGRVWNTPNPDRGVTFRFTLPLPPPVRQRASG
jgi:PAS domain S-box-containing protein